VGEEMQIGYADDAPFVELSELKNKTKYPPSYRSSYPPYVGTLVEKSKHNKSSFNQPQTFNKFSSLKIYTQPKLLFKVKERLEKGMKNNLISKDCSFPTESLQEIIIRLKTVCVKETNFMNEEEYVECDNNIKHTNILSFEEIAQMVKEETQLKVRCHKRKNKDAKPIPPPPPADEEEEPETNPSERKRFRFSDNPDE
jgi:hypothetical protein